MTATSFVYASESHAFIFGPLNGNDGFGNLAQNLISGFEGYP